MTRDKALRAEIPEVCPHCYFGRIQPKKHSFITMAHGRRLVIPDFPAWMCDVCGFTIYDPTSLANLHRLLTNPSKPFFQQPQAKPSKHKSAKLRHQPDQSA